LDRLSISLGGNTIVPVASEQLPAYLAAPEWQKRHAALIALAQIAEGSSKVVRMLNFFLFGYVVMRERQLEFRNDISPEKSCPECTAN